MRGSRLPIADFLQPPGCEVGRLLADPGSESNGPDRKQTRGRGDDANGCRERAKGIEKTRYPRPTTHRGPRADTVKETPNTVSEETGCRTCGRQPHIRPQLEGCDKDPGAGKDIPGQSLH